jgi:hypothetical protein
MSVDKTTDFILDPKPILSFTQKVKKLPIFQFFFAVLYSIYDFCSHDLNNLETPFSTNLQKSRVLYFNYSNLKLKQKIQSIFFSNHFIWVDVLAFFLKSLSYFIFSSFNSKQRIDYRLKRTDQGFYINYLDANTSRFYY